MKIRIHDEYDVKSLKKRKYNLEEKQAIWDYLDKLKEENEKLKKELKKKNATIKNAVLKSIKELNEKENI